MNHTLLAQKTLRQASKKREDEEEQDDDDDMTLLNSISFNLPLMYMYIFARSETHFSVFHASPPRKMV